MRIAYLGPAGTFLEDALREAMGDADAEIVPAPNVYDAIRAVDSGSADRALVPFENSIEGMVRSTLDTLAFDTPSVTIVGEHDHPIRHSLIAHPVPRARSTVLLAGEARSALGSSARTSRAPGPRGREHCRGRARVASRARSRGRRSRRAPRLRCTAALCSRTESRTAPTT